MADSTVSIELAVGLSAVSRTSPLRNGATFQARVFATRDPGLLVVRGGGIRFTIPNQAELAPGARVVVQVLSVAAGVRVRVTRVDAPTVDAQPVRFVQYTDAISHYLLSALVRAERSVARSTLGGLYRRFERLHKQLNRSMEPATSPEPWAARLARAIVEAHGRAASNARYADPGDEWLSPRADREEPRGSKEEFPLLSIEAFRRATESAENAFQAYNHLAPQAETDGGLHWVAIPLELRDSAVGSVRALLRVGYERSTDAVRRAALEVVTPTRRWWFALLVHACTATRLQWGCRPDVPEKVQEQLSGLVASCGIRHTVYEPFERFDGFDAQEMKFAGVDGYG